MWVHTDISSLKEWGEEKDREGSVPLSLHQNLTPLRSDLSQQRRTHSTNSFSGSSFKLKWDKLSHTFFYTCDRNSKMNSLKTAENDTRVPTITQQRMSKQVFVTQKTKSCNDWDALSVKSWLLCQVFFCLYQDKRALQLIKKCKNNIFFNFYYYLNLNFF